MRNTKKRLELLDYLRSGGFLELNISGWFDMRLGAGKRIRVETQDWLTATGELIETRRRGKYGTWFKIRHKDCDTLKEGEEYLRSR